MRVTAMGGVVLLCGLLGSAPGVRCEEAAPAAKPDAAAAENTATDARPADTPPAVEEKKVSSSEQSAPSEETPKLQISGEVKQRGEARRHNDFGTGESGDPQFVGQLIRLRFSGTVSQVGYAIELLDGREFGAEAKTGSAVSTGLVQGYLEFGQRTRLRVGRQEVTLGKKRQIGASGWAYKGLPAYDGARFLAAVGRGELDVFAVKVAEGSTTANDDTGLAAVSYSWNGSKVWRPGAYVLFSHQDSRDGWAGSTDMPIGGLIGNVEVTRGLNLDYEVIYQWGTLRGLEHRAHQFHGGLNYREPGRKRYWMGVEYNLATGDDDPTDDVIKTFDKLYSINHSYYGYMDYQEPQNLRNLRFTVGGSIGKRVGVQLDFHTLKLDQPEDAWYSGKAGVSLQDPTGAAGRDVGSEIDVTVKFAVRPKVGLEAGYSRFFSGSFVETVLGGPVPDPEFGYLQLRVTF